MEALPIIAETSQALGLPLAVTLSLVVIAAAIIVAVVLRDHRHKIDNTREEVSAMKNDVNKQIAEIKQATRDEIAEIKAATGKEIAEVKGAMEKAVGEIKSEMAKQAAYHNSELSSLYKLVNGVAVDVSFIKGRMTKETK